MDKQILKERVANLRGLANKIYTSDKLPCLKAHSSDGKSCLDKEGDRRLTKAEQKHSTLGWRSFRMYDVKRMCETCGAYWMVKRAADELQSLQEFCSLEGVKQ